MPRLEKLGLRVRPGSDFELVNPEQRSALSRLLAALPRPHGAQRRVGGGRQARSASAAPTLIGALMVQQNEADAMLCGTYGKHGTHLTYIANVIGLKPGREAIRGDERADAAGAHALHLRHVRQSGSDAPSSWPRSHCWPQKKYSASA